MEEVNTWEWKIEWTSCFRSHQLLYVSSMHPSPRSSLSLLTVSFEAHFSWIKIVCARILLWTMHIPQDNYHCIFILYGSKGKRILGM